MRRVPNIERAGAPSLKMPKATKKKKEKAADFSVRQILYGLNQSDNLGSLSESQT